VEKEQNFYISAPISKKKDLTPQVTAASKNSFLISQVGSTAEPSVYGCEGFLDGRTGASTRAVSTYPVILRKKFEHRGLAMKAHTTKEVICKNQSYDVFTANPKVNLRSGLVYQLQPYNYTDSNNSTSSSYLNTLNRSLFSKNKKPMGTHQNPRLSNL